MKKTLVLLGGFLLLFAGTYASQSTDLTVTNGTVEDLGVCTFSGAGNNVELQIGPYANIDYPISFTVDSVTINGQGIAAPNSGPVTLPDGAEVLVSWLSPNTIEYTDLKQKQTPVQ